MAVGEFLRVLARRRRLLQRWIGGGADLHGWRRRGFARLMTEIDSQYYAADCGPADRERIKALCMGDESAIAWARKYLARGFPEAGAPMLPMFARLEVALASGRVGSVHQVGCCSGREVAYFAQRFPEVRFVGSDCDAELVGFLREEWRGVGNLSFELVRMDDVAGEAKREALRCDLLMASGGFHYLDAETLGGFFRDARGVVDSLFLSQPMSRSFAPDGDRRSTGRGMLSWDHAYPRLLAEAGWEPIEWEERSVEALPLWKNFAGYAGALVAGSASNSQADPRVSEVR